MCKVSLYFFNWFFFHYKAPPNVYYLQDLLIHRFEKTTGKKEVRVVIQFMMLLGKTPTENQKYAESLNQCFVNLVLRILLSRLNFADLVDWPQNVAMKMQQ